MIIELAYEGTFKKTYYFIININYDNTNSCFAADEDTKNKKKISKINVYKDYIYGKDLDKDYEGKYYSSFMHDDDHNNGGFKALFS